MIRALIDSIFEGVSKGSAEGKRYVVTKSVHNGGRSFKIYAEELGGDDFVSLNFYETSSGESLKPCEMPEEKVLRFLRDYVPDAAEDKPR
ncbi:MAG: hypothetical protein P1U87_06610 [Verrucomicrobiales bacterium]|nr:hypothetical protein [Verrucomicrobiales bacterium]